MPYIQNQGIEIFYDVIGSSGTPVILSAGMGGSSHFWNSQIKEISKSNQVILYDQAGSGKSGRNITGNQSIERMAEDVLAVLDHLKIAKAHFVGHAIGGIIGMELSLIVPDRLKSLLIINAWAKSDPHLVRCFEVRKNILQTAGKEAYIFAQPLFLYPPQWIAENDIYLKEEAKSMVTSFPPSDLILEKINLFLAYDGTNRIPNINIPTLLTTAKDDFLVPPHLTKQLKSLIKNSELIELDYGGHAFSSVIPNKFNQLAQDFFNKVDLKD